MTDIKQRIAELIAQHTQADEYGYPVEECRCHDDNDGTETWAEHVALVLMSDLGLKKEGGTIYHRAYRYVTDWERE